jgi:hypothetical protein
VDQEKIDRKETTKKQIARAGAYDWGQSIAHLQNTDQLVSLSSQFGEACFAGGGLRKHS